LVNGGSAIRGSRVGAGPMGEQYRGFKSERIERSYYCINGHVQNPHFAAHVDPAEIPETIDCPNCGLPAGQDKKNPPEIAKHEPYKTHLAYVKERRTPEEAKLLLDEAIASIRERRAKLAETTAKQAKEEAAKAKAAKAKAAKAVKSVSKKPEPKVAAKPAVKTVTKAAGKTAGKSAKAAGASKSTSKAKAAPKLAKSKVVAKTATKPKSSKVTASKAAKTGSRKK